MTRPWGALVAVIAAMVFAAPTLVLPADSPVAPKLVFIVVGGALLGVAIVLTRLEAPSQESRETDATDELSP